MKATWWEVLLGTFGIIVAGMFLGNVVFAWGIGMLIFGLANTTALGLYSGLAGIGVLTGVLMIRRAIKRGV